MLSCKTNNIMLRVVCGVLICGLLLSGAGIPSYAVTNPSDSALAPPLATKPPCEIVQKSDGSYDVVTNNGVTESWDRETARSVKAGETLGKSFRNRWAFVDVSYLIGQMLILTQQHNLQNPKDILIPLIKKHIRNRDGMAEILLEGYDIDGIEEVREGQVITGLSLPITRNGTPAYRLVYNLQDGETAIPTRDGISVYIKTENLAITPASRDEINIRLSQLQKIKDKKPDDVTEDDKQYLVGVAKHFNLYPEYLEKKTDKKEIWRYAIPLHILTSAELSALGISDVPIFTLSAVDEIGNGFFSHELAHTLDDLVALSYLFHQEDEKKLVQDSNVQKEIDRLENAFRDHYAEETLGWMLILAQWKGLGALNPKIILALINGLAKNLEEVVSTRADLVRYIEEHRNKIDESIVSEYFEEAKKADDECKLNLIRLKEIRRQILHSNENTLVAVNESVSEASQPYKGSKRFELQLQLASDTPYIYGNTVRVSYIWTNLIRNSMDAIFETRKADKERMGRVVIKTNTVIRDNKRFAEITVSDNGNGIPAEMLRNSRLFQKGETTKERGTGLGLYLIKQTVEELGGTIDVQSELGKGTTFTIRLPIALQELVANAEDTGIVSKPQVQNDGYKKDLTHNVASGQYQLELLKSDLAKTEARLAKMTDETPANRRESAINHIVWLKERIKSLENENITLQNRLDLLSGKVEEVSKVTTTPVAISPETERIHATNFQDTLTYIQAQPQTQPLIVALGTSWIKGYEKGRYLQYDALNPLIGSLRTYCESKGIPFIVDDDDKLLAHINAERAKQGKAGAKVVVLAGKDTVVSDEFATLRNDQEKAFVVGVDSQELTTDSYIRLMEMLTLALKLSAGLEVSLNNDHITITKDNERHLYIFLPHAEPMDYERLKVIYEVQKFA